jgi:uncharacterized protein YndB with AHSA1/START domain
MGDNAEFQRDYTYSLTIQAPVEVILDAFFDHELLASWWHISRSLCVPRTLGCYVVEWEPTDWVDGTLGRLGGVFHGQVMSFDPQREFFLADCYWMAPDGDPIGPMAFEVACARSPSGVVVHIRQTGFEESARWSRYYEVLGAGLTASLERLKKILENRWRP